MMNWQPIETAPKDGSAIMLLFGDSVPDTPFIQVGSYCTEAELEELGIPWDGGGWLMFDIDGCSWEDCPIDRPKFWMPLPPPPIGAS